MKLEVLVYCPFLEEESTEGWDKETIEYIQNNRQKVMRAIYGIARSMGRRRLQTTDIEDIYSQLLLYMYKTEDYDVLKATSGCGDGRVLSLEGYINSCIKYCILRHIQEEGKEIRRRARNKVEDGRELELLDTVPDEEANELFDEILIDLKEYCDMCEHSRYKYGPDIFLVWYVRLLTLGKREGLYEKVLEVLGIDRGELIKVEELSRKDGLMAGFAKAITTAGIDASINIIEDYVYSAARIREVIEQY